MIAKNLLRFIVYLLVQTNEMPIYACAGYCLMLDDPPFD
jgi:hypothetical protein